MHDTLSKYWAVQPDYIQHTNRCIYVICIRDGVLEALGVSHTLGKWLEDLNNSPWLPDKSAYFGITKVTLNFCVLIFNNIIYVTDTITKLDNYMEQKTLRYWLKMLVELLAKWWSHGGRKGAGYLTPAGHSEIQASTCWCSSLCTQIQSTVTKTNSLCLSPFVEGL